VRGQRIIYKKYLLTSGLDRLTFSVVQRGPFSFNHLTKPTKTHTRRLNRTTFYIAFRLIRGRWLISKHLRGRRNVSGKCTVHTPTKSAPLRTRVFVFVYRIRARTRETRPRARALRFDDTIAVPAVERDRHENILRSNVNRNVRITCVPGQRPKGSACLPRHYFFYPRLGSATTFVVGRFIALSTSPRNFRYKFENNRRLDYYPFTGPP